MQMSQGYWGLGSMKTPWGFVAAAGSILYKGAQYMRNAVGLVIVSGTSVH